MRYFWIFFLICGVCFAETINEKYSYKAFSYHGLSFKDRPVSEFNNTIIRGSCFYQEWREGDKEIIKDIFPDGMTGVTFEKCNLDNIFIPDGNTINEIKGGCHRKIAVQNDWDDWILDDDLRPIKPTNKEQRLKAGVSIDPKDIPKKKFTKEERKQFEESMHEKIIIIMP